MAYEGNQDDELRRQLEQQMQEPVRQYAPSPYAEPPLNDAVAGAREALITPNPLGGPNTGVAGPKPGGNTTQPAPMDAAPANDRAAQARAAQANNYTDIGSTDALKTGGYLGSLEGFNTQGWGSGERGSGTLKNKFGQIASRYDPTQQGAAKALMADQDFREFWPDAQLIDHPNGDLIDFDGPGGDPPVDVLRAAEAGGAGQAWQWGVQDGGGGGAAGPSASGMTVDGLMGGDPFGGINSEIAKLLGGQQGEEQTLIQQLLAEMQR